MKTPHDQRQEDDALRAQGVIDLRAIGRWLRFGAADLRRSPGPGLTHGVIFTFVGWLLLWVAGDQFWWLVGAYSGFLIVAPLAVTGLYEVSRQGREGHRMSLFEIGLLWLSFDRRLVQFGCLLGLAGLGWVLSSAALVTGWAPDPVARPLDFLHVVVLAPEGYLFELWLLMGGVLAAPMFASSVIAMPMLIGTRAGVWQSVTASWRVCAAHPMAMASWAATLMVFVGLGMLTGLFGLIVVTPWLAHASWHAYEDAQAWLDGENSAPKDA